MSIFLRQKYIYCYCLIIICVLLVAPLGVSAHVTAVLNQTNYWFRADDGSESAATGFNGAAQDTAVKAAADAQLRIRIGWGETAGGSTNNSPALLQYSSDDNGSCTTGTWTDVTPTSASWQYFNSQFVADKEATTQQITSGTFRAGQVTEAQLSADSVSFSGNDRSEHEWTLQGNSPTAGTTYYFRLTNNGTALDNYSVCATLTVDAKPDQPTNSSPTNGATSISLNPSLTGSTYSEPDGDPHTDTEWRIDNDSDFSSPVWTRAAGTGEETTTVNTTNGTFANEQSGAAALKPDTTYYWQVRYNDGNVWSDWSTATSFTTTEPTYEQSAYRFFENANSTDVGTPLAGQDTAATLASAGQAFRLRMLLHMGGGVNLPLSGKYFDLQVAEKGGGTCISPSGSYNRVATPWQINSSSYDNINPLFNQGDFGKDVSFKTDGTRMFLAFDGINTFFQYDLSTPWDVTTAVYNNVSYASSANVRSVWFKDDGTKFYGADPSSQVVEYTPATPWDLSNVTLSASTGALSISGQIRDAFFNDQGTKMYVVDEDGIVYQYSLSVAWDLSSTLTYDNVSLDLSGQGTLFKDGEFGYEGRRLYVQADGNNTIFQYSLATPYDLSTATYNNYSFDYSAQTAANGFTFKGDGSKFWLVGADERLYQYSIASGTDFIFYDNASVVDAAALTSNVNDPVHGGDSTNNQIYKELNSFTNSQSAIASGEDGMWDFSLIDNGATSNTTFCFRAVQDDGTVLDTYTNYPEITTYAEAAVSISISDGVISYGTLDANTSTTTIALSDTQTVTNDGTGTIDLNIKGQDTACPWTLASTNGVDQYIHEFSTTTGATWFDLTTIYQTMATGIATSGTEDFDLRITTPTDSTCGDVQSTDVTVQAVAQ